MESTRPRMPASYGLQPPTSEHGLLGWDWVETRLADAKNYWLVTSTDAGRPHAMPIWAVWQQGELAWSTSRRSRKARNLLRNPQAVVHLESGDEVVVLEGEARPLASARRDSYLVRYREKYGIEQEPESEETIHFGFRAAKAFAWREADFPSSATRWTFPAAVGDDQG